jgi:hypothetical protein
MTLRSGFCLDGLYAQYGAVPIKFLYAHTAIFHIGEEMPIL